MRSTLTLLTCFALAATAGCARSDRVAAVCPDSAIIHGLDRMYGEDAAGREITVTLENIDGVCTYSGNQLSLEMTVDLVVEAAPGTVIPYFVVTADPSGEVLDKTFFVATVPSEPGLAPLRIRERLVQEVNGVAAGTSAGYSVLFGLDLPPEIAIEQRRTL